MNEGIPVLGYARVSTQEQAGQGYGLDAQELAITEACGSRGWTLRGVVRDEGESAKTLDRPGLSSALSGVAERTATGLVVAKLDRLTRSVADFAALLEWFSDADATLVALDLGIDTSTPGGRLVANVFASVAEWEREVIGLRTREGLAAARQRGVPISGPAVADQPKLEARIRRMRARGMTLQAIADRLNQDGISTLRGGVAWRPSSVQAASGYKRRPPRRRPAQLPKLSRRKNDC